MKRFVILFAVAALAAMAQTSTCSQNGTFTSATNGSTKDNRLNSTGACINWRLTYQSTGLSALSIEIQGAPDSAGTAGTFVTITGPLQGSQPSTLLQGEVLVASYYPWIRVKVNTFTTTGTITYNLNGVNATVALQRNSSGGGSGSGVTSFNARTGVVVPVSGDYTCADVTNCVTGALTQAYSTAEDEGTPVTQRSTINFTGAGVSVADTGGKTTVTIPAGGSFYQTVADEASNLTQRPLINFTGAGVSCADDAGNTRTNCTIAGGSGGLTVDGFYLKDGSTYYISPSMQVATLPSAGIYSWVNQGSSTETAVQNGLVLESTGNGGLSIHARTVAIGTDTQLTVAMMCNLYPADFNSCGIGFRESATQKMGQMMLPLVGGPKIAINYLTDATNFSSSPVAGAGYGCGAVTWARLIIGGSLGAGNLGYYYSCDGVNFVQVLGATVNTHFTITPNQWFYYANPQTNGALGSTTLLSWKTE